MIRDHIHTDFPGPRGKKNIGPELTAETEGGNKPSWRLTSAGDKQLPHVHLNIQKIGTTAHNSICSYANHNGTNRMKEFLMTNYSTEVNTMLTIICAC